MNNIPQRPTRSYALPIVVITFVGVCSYYGLRPIIASWRLFWGLGPLLIAFLLLGGIILSFILSFHSLRHNGTARGRLPLSLSVLLLVMIVLIESTGLARRWELGVHSPEYAPLVEQQDPQTTHVLFIRDEGFAMWSVSGFLYSRDNTVPATCGEDSALILASSKPVRRSWFWVTGRVNEGIHRPPTRCVILYR
jgi:hypothetical protein